MKERERELEKVVSACFYIDCIKGQNGFEVKKHSRQESQLFGEVTIRKRNA